MAFVALDKHGHRVDLSEFRNPRGQLHERAFRCQLCDGKMILKAGHVVRPHFAHKSKCRYEGETEPETGEHLAGKHWTANWLTCIWEEYGTLNVQVEYRVPELKRIVDVAAVYPSGWVIGCEVQFSRTSTRELESRTRDYEAAGIDPVWFFGGQADTFTNRRWCANRLGYGYSIEVSEPDECDINVEGFSRDNTYMDQSNRMKRVGIRRALEIWERLSCDDIRRACNMTTEFGERSLGGLLGTMNAGNKANGGRRTIRKTGNEWSLVCHVDSPAFLKATPMSDDAVSRAKKRARAGAKATTSH